MNAPFPGRSKHVALGLLILLGTALVALLFRDLGPWGLAAAAAAALAGLRLRVAFIETPKFREAERLWAAGADPYEVVRRILAPGLLPGELGHQARLLRARALLALGDRDRAWHEGLQAQLRRLPLWKRIPVAWHFKRLGGTDPQKLLARTRRLCRLAPASGRLQHLRGIFELRHGSPSAAWEAFARALPLSWNDPLVLEDLLRAAQDDEAHRDLADGALDLLRNHHGDPRLAWDRAAAVRFLVNEGRAAEAIALLRPLAPGQRSHPWHWAGLVIAHRQLGDLDEARRVVEAGLARFPDAFRLWMERFQIALDRHADAEAGHSLDRAEACLPEGPAGEAMRWEWRSRQAEYAFWVLEDPEAAQRWLETVPEGFQDDHHPPLRLQILVALGAFEEAQACVAPLLAARPDDVELQMVQADVLAGLEAWKALLPFLDRLADAARSRALFWHLRGLALVHLGNPQHSRQDLERAAHMEPSNVRFVLDAGHACAELGEWDRSETHWRQALRLDRENEEALVQLSDARLALHDASGARAFLRECLTLHPESVEAQVRLAELEAH